MSTNKSVLAPRSTYSIIACSSLAIVVWRVLQWRARKLARTVADRAQRMVQDGPMFGIDNSHVRNRLINIAIRRAKQWITFQTADDVKPMLGQLGGISLNKKPILTLPPDYILKPLHTDARGFREVGFYEMLKFASQNKELNTALAGVEYDDKSSAALHKCDAVALSLAIFMEDQNVAQAEHKYLSSWLIINNEVEMLKRLSTFTASYYGVMGQDLLKNHLDEQNGTIPSPAISSSSYLLLSDETFNFQHPCVIDIKMGRQSFEPGAPSAKRDSEMQKYPQQDLFGFRIVGMRRYDPCHLNSDDNGFRKFDKMFGRELDTREKVSHAFKTFFCVATPEESNQEVSKYNEPLGSSIPSARIDRFIRVGVVHNLISQLKIVRKWFDENKSLAFYSSSILMVYEGGLSPTSCDTSNLKMIDFAHVRRQDGGDEGYACGLHTLLSLLNDVLDQN